MSVALDIVRTYRSPRSVLRRRIGSVQREDRALAVLMGACVVMFVAQWPRLARESHLDDTIEFNALLAGALFGWVLVAPLFFYVVSWLSHAALRLLGSQASGYEARMAMFWALLASSPLWLLAGLTAGFVGPGIELQLVGSVALAAFGVFWFVGLIDLYRVRKESAS